MEDKGQNDKDLHVNPHGSDIMLAELPYLLCSAIWYKDLPTMRLLPKNCDKGIVLCGWRHGNIIAQMQATMGLRTVVRGKIQPGNMIKDF